MIFVFHLLVNDFFCKFVCDSIMPFGGGGGVGHSAMFSTVLACEEEATARQLDWLSCLFSEDNTLLIPAVEPEVSLGIREFAVGVVEILVLVP